MLCENTEEKCRPRGLEPKARPLGGEVFFIKILNPKHQILNKS